MRGLTIILATPDFDRLRSAFRLTATQAALGGAARLFLDGPSARLLISPITAPDDAFQESAGQPTLAQLYETALELGVAILVCQSGLALAGVGAHRLDPRIEVGGLTSVMARLADDRLVAL